MDKLVRKILKESGVTAKINSNNSNKPKFRIVNNKLTLEGIVTKTDYSMTIKDPRGKIVDSLTVAISNGNDIANRINESITTLNALSPIYDKQVSLKEEEDFEEIPDIQPGDTNGLINQLDEIYTSIMDLASKVSKFTDYLDEDDVEGANEIIGISSSLYDVALDISDYSEDVEDTLLKGNVQEHFKPLKTEKYVIKNVINNLTEAQVLLKGHKNLITINNAIKDIKSDLVLRSK